MCENLYYDEVKFAWSMNRTIYKINKTERAFNQCMNSTMLYTYTCVRVTRLLVLWKEGNPQIDLNFTVGIYHYASFYVTHKTRCVIIVKPLRGWGLCASKHVRAHYHISYLTWTKDEWKQFFLTKYKMKICPNRLFY